MYKEALPEAKRYAARGRRWRIRQTIVGSLACAVVFITTYALTLPAITMEQESYCGQEEHVHDANCYAQIMQQQTTLSCCYETLGVHVHTAVCYDADGNLRCGVADYVLHTHDAGCYDAEGNLICQLPEVAAHVHTDACDTAAEPETVTEHIHDENCFVITYTEPELTCRLAEGGEHIHSEMCYGIWEPVCEKQEHTHGLSCYADRTADVETAADWEAAFADVKLTGIWADDVLTIAGTQLGYQESAKNYIVLEDGETVKGYSRYGAWYGNDYGDWCAMFVSFCLHYAEADGIPLDADCAGWINVLSSAEYGLYADADSYQPKPGDLIFFDREQNGVSDHVGLVAEMIGATDTEPVQIKTIEGDSGNRVQYVTYTAGDENIMGYGIMPENPQLPMTLELEDTSTAEYPEEQTGEETDVSVGESTDGEGSLAGNQVYHSPYNLKYQESSHDLDGFGVVTFVLIPQEDIGEDGGASWEANTVEWTARTDANYIVAYCSDAMTSTSTTGAAYTTFTLDTARFTSEEQRRVLSGIIAHSYPFITGAEMKAQLAAAYEAGEITEPLVLSAKETEYMAAAQWAIWQTTLLAQSFTYADGCEFSYTDQCLNPLTDPGMTDSTDINNCVKAIKNWLVQQIEPIELEVELCEYTVTPVDYDLFDLEVTVTLNRAVQSGERAEYLLTVGSRSTDAQILEAGTDAFTITLTELTKEELNKAQVLLTVGGEHMQAYFYDSNNHQDLISGNWEYYSHDLSFEVGVDTIDISVTKHWTDGTENAPEISVQLYANGEAYRDPVKLNEENNWTYIWEDMLARDALGNEIDYTLQEQLIDGYDSNVEKFGTDAVETVQLWEKVDAVEPGGQYVLLSSFTNEAGLNVSTGALTWSENDSRDTSSASDLLSWNYVDLSDPEKTAAKAVWTTAAGENGGFYLTNNGDGFHLYGTGTIYLHESSKTEYYFSGGYLCVNSSCSSFFMDIFSNGKAYTDTDPDAVTVFIPYKLVTKELPKGDINFVLTNTKIETEVTSLTVTKQWEGRPDGVYPEKAVVSLTRNGRIYGGQITLTAENDWSYTWKGLPVADQEGNAFIYSVEEISPEGYTGEAVLDETDGSYYVTLTNTWAPDAAPVKLQKVDLATYEFLPGAVFDIYLTTNNTGELVPGTADVYGTRLEPVTVGEDGTVTLQLAPDETYYLVETKAPDGYNTPEEPIGFTVVKRGSKIMLTLLNGEDWAEGTAGTAAVLTVKNEMGYVLPETGGTGAASYTVAGLSLTMGAACLMYISGKRRKGERSS